MMVLFQEDEILAYVDADNMTQFELIKSEKPVNVLNKYIYLKDTRILTSTARYGCLLYLRR